ncbi:serine/threonine protein phosphatase [Colletotrichum kahawae]|uniref:Serine/threonine protein phosphatase n=1 Tax=Colletotrichum kahawae TaxID=34407 RepID=A0AAD9YWI3_COLKA|nr:serine/threonine protein phosphatase [Colletotrichum kahawae]
MKQYAKMRRRKVFRSKFFSTFCKMFSISSRISSTSHRNMTHSGLRDEEDVFAILFDENHCVPQTRILQIWVSHERPYPSFNKRVAAASRVQFSSSQGSPTKNGRRGWRQCLASTSTALPGAIMPESDQQAAASAAPHTNGSGPVSPLNYKDNSIQPTIDGLDLSSTEDGLFGSPSINANNLTRELSLVEDQFARFSVWAATLRIFGANDTCLDHRLREASDLRDMVVGLLNILTHRIQHCADTMESIRSTTNSSSSLVADDVGRFHYSLEGITAHIDFLYDALSAEKTFVVKDEDSQ